MNKTTKWIFVLAILAMMPLASASLEAVNFGNYTAIIELNIPCEINMWTKGPFDQAADIKTFDGRIWLISTPLDYSPDSKEEFLEYAVLFNETARIFHGDDGHYSIYFDNYTIGSTLSLFDTVRFLDSIKEIKVRQLGAAKPSPGK
jgi:hypothetical protein